MSQYICWSHICVCRALSASSLGWLCCWLLLLAGPAAPLAHRLFCQGGPWRALRQRCCNWLVRSGLLQWQSGRSRSVNGRSVVPVGPATLLPGRVLSLGWLLL